MKKPIATSHSNMRNDFSSAGNVGNGGDVGIVLEGQKAKSRLEGGF
ncbi:MAG: hypothetical protein V4718_09210 [Pseudomonadota bacterium]